jgi:hypothetical protein
VLEWAKTVRALDRAATAIGYIVDEYQYFDKNMLLSLSESQFESEDGTYIFGREVNFKFH